MPWLITPGRNFRARQLAANLYWRGRAHAKHFFLLFSARLRPRQWMPLHYLSGIFGVCARVEIYTSAQENNQIPIRARVSNKMRELLFKTPERERRPLVRRVWICASVEIVRAALLRPWIFDYSFRLTKHREPVFEKQSFCLERRRRAKRIFNETNSTMVLAYMGYVYMWKPTMKLFFVSFLGKVPSRERWTQLIWYCRAGNNSPSCYNNCKLNYWLCTGNKVSQPMNPLKSLRKSPDKSNISVIHSILGFTTWLGIYVKMQNFARQI